MRIFYSLWMLFWLMLCFLQPSYALDTTTTDTPTAPALAPAPDSWIMLEGFLSQERFHLATQQLERIAKSTNPDTDTNLDSSIILLIHSTSGDLSAALDFATQLAHWKVEHRGTRHGTIEVYIDGSAIGPSALFPFLADRISAGFGATWGDIPYAAEEAVPANQLRSRLWTLMSERKGESPLWQELAEGMIEKGKPFKPLHLRGEPQERLILNTQQMQALHLIDAPIEKEHFFAEHGRLLPALPAQEKTQDQCGEKLRGRIKATSGVTGAAEVEPTVGYLKIDDRTSGITPATWLYIRAGLEHYKKTRPLFVIVELNTPGGEVYPAQQISDALKNLDTQDEIPVVVFINNWAISAGAMIAYSARVIATSKDGSMGAAEPVLMGAEGKMETASEKINSALRTDFANRARFFGRDPTLAEGMVDKDPPIVLRHGKIIKLGSDQEVRKEGPDPDIVIKPKGKLLTLDALAQLKYGVADCMIEPVKIEPITPSEQAAGKWPTKKHPLFSDPFFASLPPAQIDAFYPDWKLHFFAFLARPEVSSLLFMLLIMGIYMEVSSPGAALPGSIALIAFLCIALSSYAYEASHWLEYIFILSGMALILLEVLVLPTWGLLGAAGGLAFFAGILSLMLPSLRSISFDPTSHTWNPAGQVFVERLWWLIGSLIASLICIVLLWRYFAPKIALWSSFVLTGEQESSKGFYAGLDPKALPKVGSKGKVLATMRPAGRVWIEGKSWDAVSTGGFIEEGEPIIVLRIEGGRMFVTQDLPQGERP